MSWLFSQALVAAYSEDNCLDGEPSAQLNVMPTPHGFWRNDKMMAVSKLSQFGLTLNILTENHGEALLTSYLAAFPVKTSAALEKVKVLPENDLAYGNPCTAWFAKYDHDLSLWKIPQCSLLEDWESFTATWPRQGMIVNGYAYPQVPVVHPTNATVSGYSLPTPTSNPDLPNRRSHTKGPKNLLEVARGCWGHLWPTPTAHMSKETNSPSEAKRHQPSLSSLVGGKLNPEWVEWLMGWPLGWTDLKPLAMDKYQQWLNKHGKTDSQHETR